MGVRSSSGRVKKFCQLSAATSDSWLLQHQSWEQDVWRVMAPEISGGEAWDIRDTSAHTLHHGHAWWSPSVSQSEVSMCVRGQSVIDDIETIGEL